MDPHEPRYLWLFHIGKINHWFIDDKNDDLPIKNGPLSQAIHLQWPGLGGNNLPPIHCHPCLMPPTEERPAHSLTLRISPKSETRSVISGETWKLETGHVWKPSVLVENGDSSSPESEWEFHKWIFSENLKKWWFLSPSNEWELKPTNMD